MNARSRSRSLVIRSLPSSRNHHRASHALTNRSSSCYDLDSSSSRRIECACIEYKPPAAAAAAVLRLRVRGQASGAAGRGASADPLDPWPRYDANVDPRYPQLTHSLAPSRYASPGSYLFNDKGERYLDFACGIGVTNTGHSHPDIVRAVQKQASQACHIQMNAGYHQPMIDLVKHLLPVLPRGLESLLYVAALRHSCSRDARGR